MAAFDCTTLSTDEQEVALFHHEARLKTYKAWPNDPDWFCTPERLCNAGFYFKPCVESLDNVCCVFCFKELDNWDPDDDPLEEHKRHSPKCPYLSITKPIEDLTVFELFKLLSARIAIKINRIFDKSSRELGEQAALSRSILTTKFPKVRKAGLK